MVKAIGCAQWTAGGGWRTMGGGPRTDGTAWLRAVGYDVKERGEEVTNRIAQLF